MKPSKINLTCAAMVLRTCMVFCAAQSAEWRLPKDSDVHRGTLQLLSVIEFLEDKRAAVLAYEQGWR